MTLRHLDRALFQRQYPVSEPGVAPRIVARVHAILAFEFGDEVAAFDFAQPQDILETEGPEAMADDGFIIRRFHARGPYRVPVEHDIARVPVIVERAQPRRCVVPWSRVMSNASGTPGFHFTPSSTGTMCSAVITTYLHWGLVRQVESSICDRLGRRPQRK